MAEVERAVTKLGLSIHTKRDALNLLSTVSLTKNNLDRLCAWLLALDVVPEITPRALSRLCTSYTELQEKLLKNTEQPLDDVPKRERRVIKADIERSRHWFHTIAKELKIPSSMTQNGVFHAYRILSLLSLSDKYCEYTQGYDRYLYVTYSLGLIFARKAGLADTFAEAMSYHLSLKIIKLTKVADVLDDIKSSQPLFEKLDKLVSKNSPLVAEMLEEMGHGSFHYAMKWRILLFADDHKIDEVLLLWDMIFMRKSELEAYSPYLALGHVMQVPPDEDRIMVEQLQKWCKWDCPALVTYANRRYSIEKYRTPAVILTLIVVLIVAVWIVLHYEMLDM